MLRPTHLKLILAVLLTLAITLFYLQDSESWIVPEPQIIVEGGKSLSYDLNGQTQFWRALNPVLDSTFPKITSLERHGKVPPIAFDKINSSFKRPDHLNMSREDVVSARQAHAFFLHQIESVPSLVYNAGSRGIVSTAGGPYLPVFVISLRMLRRTGSKLPVEVFLADAKEYEKAICNHVLPTLNARCIILSNIFRKSTASISRYQYKIFAILFSSFEELLFLDADAFPIHNPDVLFESEPFQSTGLITWPDFWIDASSHFYYEIVEKEAPPVTLRASTESGELLVSKATHRKTLLLSTYYNWYGPGVYYPLLGQGGPGEGDKDTFLPAAIASSEDFYAVHEYVRPIGHRKFTDNGSLDNHHDGSAKVAGSAMVQHDPIEDYHFTTTGTIIRLKDPDAYKIPGPKGPRPFFVHAHYPKFNPATVFIDQGNGAPPPTRGTRGEDMRAWVMEERTVRDLGYDVERAFWEEIKWVGCELENAFRDWKRMTGICTRVEKYWDTVFASES